MPPTAGDPAPTALSSVASPPAAPPPDAAKHAPTPAVHVALLVVQLAFASGAIAGKLALNREGVDPTALACIRALGGAIVFQLVAFVARARRRGPAVDAPRITRADHLRLALYAVLGVCVNQAFFLHGLKRGTATSTTLLAATIPVFTAAVAVIARQERIRARTAIGITLATAGVVTLTGVRDVSIGNLLVTINSLSYAIYLVGVRPLLQRHGATTVIAWVFTYGALLMLPFGALSIVRDAPHWSTNGALLVAWFIAVPTVVAYLANAWALARARSSLVAGYIYLQPLLVTLTARAWLGEQLTPRLLIAGAAILTGLAVIATRARGAR